MSFRVTVLPLGLYGKLRKYVRTSAVRHTASREPAVRIRSWTIYMTSRRARFGTVLRAFANWCNESDAHLPVSEIDLIGFGYDAVPMSWFCELFPPISIRARKAKLLV
jgi:hypothetical protein